jgi:hypothetical protein
LNTILDYKGSIETSVRSIETKKEKLCAILHMTEVILHEFVEDEGEISFDTQVMECNTLTEGRVLIIESVALKKKIEICEQNYAAHATYSTKVERMNLGKMLILPKKGTIRHLMVRGSKPIVVVLERVEHNTLSFF